MAKTLYTLSNLSPNSVVAVPVSDNGTLSEASLTPTGGDGGVYLSPDGETPEPVDALASADPVVRSGNVSFMPSWLREASPLTSLRQFLYVVNAGSDSVSVFTIDPCDSTNLSLVGDPVQLDGNFPVTIAVSEELALLCVGTVGTENGIECFKKSASGQLSPDGFGLRSFGIDTPTPPTMTTDGVSDLFFSRDNKRLYAPVKGNGLGNDGWISVFPVANGSVATKDIRTTPSGIEYLFGGFQVPGSDNEIFLSDSSFGGVVLRFDDSGNATLVGKGVASPAVSALCWAQYSNVSQSAWVTSPVSNSLLAYDVNTAAVIGQTNITNPNGGLGDFVVPGKYLYGLATGASNGTIAGIAVVDISKGSTSPETVQFFSIGHGVNNYAAGLAYWA